MLAQQAVVSVSRADSLAIEYAVLLLIRTSVRGIVQNGGAPSRVELELRAGRAPGSRDSLRAFVTDSILSPANRGDTTAGVRRIVLLDFAWHVAADSMVVVPVLLLGPSPGACVAFATMIQKRAGKWKRDLSGAANQHCIR